MEEISVQITQKALAVGVILVFFPLLLHLSLPELAFRSHDVGFDHDV
jgi:hypothetical protein